MSQNVSATCTADVTAPLANSSPKSRLALAVEPPDQPPRYPPPDRIHPSSALILTAASRPFGSACISAPERAVTLDDLISVEIYQSKCGQMPHRPACQSNTKLLETADQVDKPAINKLTG